MIAGEGIVSKEEFEAQPNSKLLNLRLFDLTARILILQFTILWDLWMIYLCWKFWCSAAWSRKISLHLQARIHRNAQQSSLFGYRYLSLFINIHITPQTLFPHFHGPLNLLLPFFQHFFTIPQSPLLLPLCFHDLLLTVSQGLLSSFALLPLLS